MLVEFEYTVREYPFGEYAVGAGGDSPPAFVNQVMMEGTEHDQVVQAGFPAVQPVLDVVPVKEGRVCAPGEGAAAITKHQGAAYGRRDAASAAADVQCFPISS